MGNENLPPIKKLAMWSDKKLLIYALINFLVIGCIGSLADEIGKEGTLFLQLPFAIFFGLIVWQLFKKAV